MDEAPVNKVMTGALSIQLPYSWKNLISNLSRVSIKNIEKNMRCLILNHGILKRGESMQGLFFLFRFGLSQEKKYIIYNFLGTLIDAFNPIALAIFSRHIIQSILQHDFKKVIHFAVLIVGFQVFFQYISKVIAYKLFSSRIVLATKFSKMISKKLSLADYGKLEDVGYFDLKEKAQKFLYGDYRGFSYLLDKGFEALKYLIQVISSIAIMRNLGIWMTLFLLIILVSGAVIEFKFKKEELKISLESINSERQWNYYTNLFSSLDYAKEIRSNSLQKWLLQRESKFTDEVIETYRKREKHMIKFFSYDLVIELLVYSLSYSYLIYMLFKNNLGAADFTLYIGILMIFSSAVKTTLFSWNEIKSYEPYFRFVDEFINMKTTINTKTGINEIVTGMNDVFEIRNLSFRYSNTERDVFQNLDITFNLKPKMAIVGENGSGKTTLIKMLLRIYDPDSGEILFNGNNLKELNYEKYSNKFAVVFQDFKLFEFSIKDNIILNRPFDPEKFNAILRDVGLFEFVYGLGNTYNTVISRNLGKDGIHLSGGQQQKLALARALYKDDANILILDEPTAALDPVAEMEFYHLVDRISKEKTVLFITHRVESILFCDEIIFVTKSGDIIVGSHNMLQNEPAYQNMYDTKRK